MTRRSRSSRYPRQVHGVDFSGAQDAGKRIWVASGVVESDVLRVEDCRQAAELPGSGRDRDRALGALRDFIATSGDSALGLDFPFGLPWCLVEESNWESFVRSFPDAHRSPEEFKQACLEAAGGRECKRLTDHESRTPFAPYNLRLYKQTFFGIRDVLAPLVRGRQARVLPMQTRTVGKPWVLEICPASTLAQRQLFFSYKGGKESHSESRSRILQGIEQTTPLTVPDAIRSRVLRDRGGDALDSVVAASSVFASLPRLASLSTGKREYAIEGYVYV